MRRASPTLAGRVECINPHNDAEHINGPPHRDLQGHVTAAIRRQFASNTRRRSLFLMAIRFTQLRMTPAIDSRVPNSHSKGSAKSTIRIAPIQMGWGDCRIIAELDPRCLLCRKFAVEFPVTAADAKKKAIRMTIDNSLSPTGTGTASGEDTTALGHPGPVPEMPVRRMAGRKVVTTATLTSRTCRWPIGDPPAPDFHYCGKSPQSGSPYCESHDRLSYQPVSRRK